MSQPGQADDFSPGTFITPSGFTDFEDIVEHPPLPDHIQETASAQEIISLKLLNLEKIEDLIRSHPNFPQSMPRLQSLGVSVSYLTERWGPSDDPFKSFPHTLECLSLERIPLYPSFCNLTSLTEFSIRDFAFIQPLDTLLDILEQNPSLKHVELRIGFKSSRLRVSKRRTRIMKELQHLTISSTKVKDIKALISRIHLVGGADLEVIRVHDEGASSFKTLLLHIMNVMRFNGIQPPPPTSVQSAPFSESEPEFRPTAMYYAHDRWYLKFLGQVGSFALTAHPSRDLQGSSFPLSFENLPNLKGFNQLRKGVRRLHLVTEGHGKLDPSLFPALETLTIEGDSDPSKTLSNFFSSPRKTPNLNTITLLNCESCGSDLKEKIDRFFSSRPTSMQSLRGWWFRDER